MQADTNTETFAHKSVKLFLNQIININIMMQIKLIRNLSLRK